MNVLYLYSSKETYTNTVYEHISGFDKFSKYDTFFCHQDRYQRFSVDLSRFDAVVIHYTIRLPFDQISDSTADALAQYPGLKVLFIQDEYDHTHRTWYWIKRLGIQQVFTVVPPEGISCVYPAEEFPGVHFVSNLTGYVPEGLSCQAVDFPPSKREIIVGYRGRSLPIRYGQLGQDKIGIGCFVKKYCESKGIRHDIAWLEEARIYGPKWYEFMMSCRATLGTESGSNVFDWDGSLAGRIEGFRNANPSATDEDVFRMVVAPFEINGLMNQVSPRIFEAIAARTVLVLYEGSYSEVVTPGVHFIPLKKDGSNLDEVFELLQDGKFVDEMSERAYQDIIGSGRYSYKTFVSMVDEKIAQTIEALNLKSSPKTCVSRLNNDNRSPLTISAIRAAPPPMPTDTIANSIRGAVGWKSLLRRMAFFAWGRLPKGAKETLRPRLTKLRGILERR
jgi:hypothetical protein